MPEKSENSPANTTPQPCAAIYIRSSDSKPLPIRLKIVAGIVLVAIAFVVVGGICGWF